jgi:hypothetical protein
MLLSFAFAVCCVLCVGCWVCWMRPCRTVSVLGLSKRSRQNCAPSIILFIESIESKHRIEWVKVIVGRALCLPVGGLWIVKGTITE